MLPTSGENVMSIAPLEIYLLRQMVTFNTYLTAVHLKDNEMSLFIYLIPLEVQSLLLQVVVVGMVTKNRIKAHYILTVPLMDVSCILLFN